MVNTIDQLVTEAVEANRLCYGKILGKNAYMMILHGLSTEFDPVIGFGKHAGLTLKSIKRLDPEYHQWILDQLRAVAARSELAASIA